MAQKGPELGDVTALRVLLAANREEDAQEIVRALERGGFEVSFVRVDTPEQVQGALDSTVWDVFLCDSRMMRFDAAAAEALMKARGLDVPFIVVGTGGEGVDGLVPAIHREIRAHAKRVERGRAREQLVLSERLTALETLAAGVAHEINNPLAAVIANLGYALDELATFREGWIRDCGHDDDAARLHEALSEASTSAGRVRTIVREMEAFARIDGEAKGQVDLARVVEQAVRAAADQTTRRARVLQRIEALPLVRGSEARLVQVFSSLIMNAVDAIPEGQPLQHHIVIDACTDDEGRARVEVKDSGRGIAPEQLPRIFEPFYTTKDVGEGTGLGLSMCRRIVISSGGDISVQSEPGRGTTVVVVLPPDLQRDRAEGA